MKAKKQTLQNGLRVIFVPMKDNPAVTVMVMAVSGSNNDPDDKQGIAHFLEHMVMKGGEKYPTPHSVSATLDAIGAESNAMTGAEFTGYYAKGNPKHFSTMMNVIADIYRFASIDEGELEKERGVIKEEINLYEDMPMARSFTALMELKYPDQPAGRHALGTKESVSKISRTDFLSFKEKHYGAKNTIVIVAGDANGREVLSEVKKHFSDLPAKTSSRRKKPVTDQKHPRLKVVHRDTDQVHLNIGLPAYKASDKRQPALQVLNAILGGGMSSRLFQLLREEMGVCYYVKSRVGEHDTHGYMAISAGVDTNRLVEVVENITGELGKLSSELVDKKELKKAKDYLIGHMFLSLEGSEGVADFFASQEILFNQIKTPSQVAREIRSVKAEDVQKVARSIFKEDRLSMSVVGKVKDEKSVKPALRL